MSNPVSTKDANFITQVESFLIQNPIYVFVTRSRTGGGGEAYFVDSIERFNSLLDSLTEAARVVVYYGELNYVQLHKDFGAFNAFELFWNKSKPIEYGILDSEDYTYLLGEGLYEWLRENCHKKVVILEVPEYYNNEFTIRAYVPQKDGTLVLGAY